MRHGFPIYGPYGYRSTLDSNSAIHRMISGYIKRDGTTTSVDNLTTTVRASLAT